MKKNKTLPIILLVMLLTLTGCTKYLTNDKKQRITNPTTGQNLTSNILCLPEDKELLKIYEENKKSLAVDYDSLQPCNKYSPTDIKYTGLWDLIFIKPLAWVIIKLGLLVKNYGLSVMILGILIRLILLPFTKKSLMQAENMKKVQPELEALQKKYDKQDRMQAMQMSQEMMMIYKKYDVNPGGGCLISFIQLPILLAFFEAINRVPAIFEGTFLTMQLGTSPSVGISHKHYIYVILIILIILTTYFSYKNTMSASTGNAEQDAQMKMTMKFMIAFIALASLSLPTALALYWIVSNAFMIVQNAIIKKTIGNNSSTGKVVKSKKAKVIKK